MEKDWKQGNGGGFFPPYSPGKDRRVSAEVTGGMAMSETECRLCSKRLNRWDRRLSKTLAYKQPLCEACIAAEYDMEKEALRARMERYFDIRPCQGI